MKDKNLKGKELLEYKKTLNLTLLQKEILIGTFIRRCFNL